MSRLSVLVVTSASPERRQLRRQVGRFLVVGGVATIVDVGLLNVLHFGLDVGPLTSKVISTIAGGVVAFVGNRHWSFDDRSQQPVRAQALSFLVVNIVALLLALLPLAITRYALGLTGVLAINLSANVVGLSLATVARFEGYRRWVFRNPVLANGRVQQHGGSVSLESVSGSRLLDSRARQRRDLRRRQRPAGAATVSSTARSR